MIGQYLTAHIFVCINAFTFLILCSSLQRYESIVAKIRNDTRVRKMIFRLTKRNTEQAIKWLPSVMTYGAGATLTMLYMTDWKVVLQYVPFYGGKFEDQS